MKVVIIEDEKLSADHLESLLLRLNPEIQLIDRADSVSTSIELLQKKQDIDLIFLDIHLADGLSFEIFKQINSKIPIIFTTAFSQYAVKAFEQNSIDYLLKPVGMEELKRSLDKFQHMKELWSKDILDKLLPILGENQAVHKSKFLVKRGESLQVIASDFIHHFIAEDGIVLLTTNEGRRFPVDYTLDQLEKETDPNQFFRINRKVFVHKSRIEKLNLHFNSRLRIVTSLLDEQSSIVSRERVADFKKWLEG